MNTEQVSTDVFLKGSGMICRGLPFFQLVFVSRINALARSKFHWLDALWFEIALLESLNFRSRGAQWIIERLVWRFSLNLQYLMWVLYCIIDAAVLQLLAEVDCYLIMSIAQMGCSSQPTTIQRYILKKYLKQQAADHLALGSRTGNKNVFRAPRPWCAQISRLFYRQGCLPASRIFRARCLVSHNFG